MKSLIAACLLLLLCEPCASAEDTTSSKSIATSMELAKDKKYDEAIAVLNTAQTQDPDNVEIQLASARVYSWQGKYDDADAILKKLLAEHPHDADTEVVQAYMNYYRGQFDEAEKGFNEVLATSPDYADASDGLRLVQEAQKAAAGYDWQLDAGYEHSSFARKPVSSWDNEFIQLTHLFDKGATALYARFENYDQFMTSDTYYELGADHTFTPYLNGFVSAGHTVDVSFRPKWHTEAGGNLRLEQNQSYIPGVWLTLDAKEDDYGSVQVANFNPGTRLEWGQWSISPSLVLVNQWGVKDKYGWNTRVDGPLWADQLRFYVGYADAPETEDAVTVYTQTVYTGISYDIDDAHTLRLGYTHDDRQDSYIRHVVDASISYRF